MKNWVQHSALYPQGVPLAQHGAGTVMMSSGPHCDEPAGISIRSTVRSPRGEDYSRAAMLGIRMCLEVYGEHDGDVVDHPTRSLSRAHSERIGQGVVVRHC